jgi:hypothetical protein
MYRWGDSFGGKEGMRIIQAGVLDDESVVDDMKVGLEMFVEKRVEWLDGLEGVEQFEGMP